MNKLVVFLCISLLHVQSIVTFDTSMISQDAARRAAFVGSFVIGSIGGYYFARYLSRSGIPEHHKWEYSWDGNNNKEITAALGKDSIFVGMPRELRRNILNRVNQLNCLIFAAQGLGKVVLENEKDAQLIGLVKYSTPYCEYSIQPLALSKKISIEIKRKNS